MKLPSLLFTLLIASSLSAQTLFTYANKSVSASEYTKAFNKVYPAPVADKAKKMRNYLDLYINSKLKIHEAMSRGYDTMPGFVEEYSALRNQVMSPSTSTLAESRFIAGLPTKPATKVLTGWW